MGTWGAGIFDNADAADIREELQDLAAAEQNAEVVTTILAAGATDMGPRGPSDWPWPRPDTPWVMWELGSSSAR